MKVLLHMITTANGFIADANSKSVSTPPDWQEFSENVQRYNNFVVGRKTFELVGEQGFANSSCDHKVIVTSQNDITPSASFTIVASPQEALEYLESKNVDTLFLVGGSELNTAFAKEALIDEAVIIVQPSLIGKGVTLFSPADFDLPLILEDVKELSGGRVKLRYTVRK